MSFFKEILPNIFTNFVLNKILFFYNKNPLWVSDLIKEEIRWGNKVYKTDTKYGKTQNDYFKLQETISSASCLIEK